MPRSSETNALVREHSRTKILMTALRLFARHGYEQTSIRMIAQEADISQGLLYNYYSGKEALLHALFARSMEDVRQSFAAAHDRTDEQSLALILRASFAILRDHLDFWRLSYTLRAQPALMGMLGDALHDWTAEIVRTLEAHLRVAGYEQPAIEAAILFATIDGVAQHYALAPDTYPLDAVIEALITRYQPQSEGETR